MADFELFYEGNHTYAVAYDKKFTWDSAKLEAERYDAHLATISSAEENQFISAHISETSKKLPIPVANDGGGAMYLWLGASDISKEGTWMWVDNLSLSDTKYTNWGSGTLGKEPDDYAKSQDALAIAIQPWPLPSGGIGILGQWNDLNQNNLLFPLYEWDYFISFVGNEVMLGDDSGVIFRGLDGDDTIVGGLGIDTAIYNFSRSNYNITVGVSEMTITALTGTEGVDTLTSIERIQFSPTYKMSEWAFDLGTDQSAGQAVLLLGAVLPGKLVFDDSKERLLATVITLIDGGYSIRDLSGAVLRLPIWDVLTGTGLPSNSDIARYLLTNVNGQAPDAAALETATSALNTEVVQGTWLSELALSSASQLHVDLVGLQRTGLEIFSF